MVVTLRQRPAATGGPDPDAYAATIRAIYERAELVILQQVRLRAQIGLADPGWAERKAAEIASLRRWLRGELPGMFEGVEDEIRQMLTKAYEQGAAEATNELIEADLLDVAPRAYTRAANVRALARETVKAVSAVHRAILRTPLDSYRSVVAAGAGEVATGVATRQQAVQRALNALADRGITGFVDKAGRHWDLGVYTEMATRTAVIRASLQGKLDKYEQADVDLVVVSDHWENCPRCEYWEGRVLSRSGKTEGYPTVEEARVDGLWHPNCRHTVAPYVPGLTQSTRVQSPSQKADVKEVYKQKQKQRHMECQIRKWKRRAMAAISRSEEMYSMTQVHKWESALGDHVASVNSVRVAQGFPRMKRQPDRERVIWAPDARRTARQASARRRKTR